MAIKIVRLGSAREADEGLRLGTVRRPPQGVSKSDYASKDFYDVWLPNLSPMSIFHHQLAAPSCRGDVWGRLVPA